MADTVTALKPITIELITQRTNSDLKTKFAVKGSASLESRAIPDKEGHPEDRAELGHAFKEIEIILPQQCLDALLREEIQRIKAENELLRDQNSTLKTDLSDTTKALRAEEREHASTAKRGQDLEDRKNDFERDAQALRDQIAELKAEKKGLAAEKRTAVSNLNSSKAKLEKDRREFVFVKEKLSDTQAEMEIQCSKVEEYGKDIQNLRKVKEKLTQELADEKLRGDKFCRLWLDTMREQRVLEKRLKIRKPLVDVGAAVRRRYFERAKQNFVNGSFINVRGVADLEAIEAGHRAAHRANFAADTALFVLYYLNIGRDSNTFEEIYLINPSSDEENFGFVTWAKRTEIFNMDATLRCLSHSNYNVHWTQSENFHSLCLQYTEAVKAAFESDRTCEEMDQDPEMNVLIEEMRRIFENIMSTTRRSRY